MCDDLPPRGLLASALFLGNFSGACEVSRWRPHMGVQPSCCYGTRILQLRSDDSLCICFIGLAESGRCGWLQWEWWWRACCCARCPTTRVSSRLPCASPSSSPSGTTSVLSSVSVTHVFVSTRKKIPWISFFFGPFWRTDKRRKGSWILLDKNMPMGNGSMETGFDIGGGWVRRAEWGFVTAWGPAAAD